jgi:hypothetical protein
MHVNTVLLLSVLTGMASALPAEDIEARQLISYKGACCRTSTVAQGRTIGFDCICIQGSEPNLGE